MKVAPMVLLVSALITAAAVHPQDETVFHADATLVTVPCVVTDKQGRPVKDLHSEDFRIYDDGKPQEIRGLWSESQLPLLVGAIVDVSVSQRDLKPEHENAVTHFLERMLGPGDRGFVVAVNENVVLKSEVIGGASGLRFKVLSRPGGEPLGVQCGTLEGTHRQEAPDLRRHGALEFGICFGPSETQPPDGQSGASDPLRRQ